MSQAAAQPTPPNEDLARSLREIYAGHVHPPMPALPGEPPTPAWWVRLLARLLGPAIEHRIQQRERRLRAAVAPYAWASRVEAWGLRGSDPVTDRALDARDEARRRAGRAVG